MPNIAIFKLYSLKTLKMSIKCNPNNVNVYSLNATRVLNAIYFLILCRLVEYKFSNLKKRLRDILCLSYSIVRLSRFCQLFNILPID